MQDTRLPSWIHFEIDNDCVLPRAVVSRRPMRSFAKREHPSKETSPANREHVEPLLVQLARLGQWSQVLSRCRSFPNDARPRRLLSPPGSPAHRRKRLDSLTDPCLDNPATLYHPTALGFLCKANLLAIDSAEELMRALLQASPDQVRCSQLVAGYTPLRTALENLSMPLSLLELLIQADMASMHDPMVLPALQQVDDEGLYPIDQVIKSVQLGTNSRALQVLQLLLQATRELIEDDSSSPLIRLLSLGTSFGLLPPTSTVRARASSRTDDARLARILDCTNKLLAWKPALVHRYSSSTGCAPLHVALRNYGNYPPLIRALIEQDRSGTVIKHRNRFGDLPIHVAAVVGVPLDVLRLVLARTLTAVEPYRGPHPLIWSVNQAGYTPVDLEWIRHIELGNGFFSHRSFYPLDSRGIRRPRGREGALYDSLLRQAVDQVTDRGEDRPAHLSTHENRAFGLLLHRIFLVIRSAFHDSFSRSPLDLSGDILHLASALSGPLGPSLPRPILDLIYRQYPEELHRQDHAGRLPLHYCFPLTVADNRTTGRATQLQDEATALAWKSWIEKLVSKAPKACWVRDHKGRLPLHHALDCLSKSRLDELPSLAQKTIADVVGMLIDTHPESIAVYDRVSGAYPFLLAGINGNLSLGLLFDLVRRSPCALELQRKASRAKRRCTTEQ